MSSQSTVADRVRRQREARLRAGWREVRVWVPTADDAKEIQDLAERLRKAAREDPSSKGQEMKAERVEAVLAAIAQQGSREFSSPSGPILDLLSEFAAAGDIRDVAAGFQMFATAHPRNANFVAAQIPAKILNQFLFRFSELPPSAFFKWEAGRKAWADELKEALRTPTEFARLVLSFRDEVAAAKEPT